MSKEFDVMIPPSGRSSFKKIADIIKGGVRIFPETGNYNGNGGPGRLLEDLLGINENNSDTPDLKDWEIKFHGGNSLLTLFHKEPLPRGIINKMVDDYGWLDEHNRISFRHTFAGKSSKGFYVVSEDQKIIIKNKINQKSEPYWPHNVLFNAIPAKLRRLIVVHGKMYEEPRSVEYQSATAYWEPDMVGLVKAIEDGIFHIDFDARTKAGRGTAIRNHGTKFRIKVNDLDKIFAHKHIIRVD